MILQVSESHENAYTINFCRLHLQHDLIFVSSAQSLWVCFGPHLALPARLIGNQCFFKVFPVVRILASNSQNQSVNLCTSSLYYPFIEKPIESYTLRFTPSACRSSASKGGSLHVVPQQQRMTELQVWHTRLYCSDVRWFTTYRVLDGSLRTGFENDKLPPVFKSGSHFWQSSLPKSLLQQTNHQLVKDPWQSPPSPPPESCRATSLTASCVKTSSAWPWMRWAPHHAWRFSLSLPLGPLGLLDRAALPPPESTPAPTTKKQTDPFGLAGSMFQVNWKAMLLCCYAFICGCPSESPAAHFSWSSVAIAMIGALNSL